MVDPRPNAYGNSYEAPLPPPTTTFVSHREEAGLGITLRESLSGRNLSVRQAFDIFDSDKNGSLDMTEMCAALYHLGLKAISAEQVMRFFHLVDEDKTGRIPFLYFHNFVEVVVEEFPVEWKPHTGLPAVVSPTALVVTFVGDGSPSDGVQIQKLPSPSVDRGDMLQLIGAFGVHIVQCQILPDVERKGSSGCIAKLAGVEHAQRLIDMMHGRELNAILASLGAGAQQAPAPAPPW